MSSRALQKDTDADRELYGCLNAIPPRSFLMIAGAGSGKTTSLIKGLTEILAKHGDALKLRRQKVACITYTEIAAGEIWADVGNNPLVHVSTIHSFLWSLVRGFQSDIQSWVSNRIDEKLADLEAAAAKFGPRVQKRTREKNQKDIVRYKQQQERIGRVRSFTYGTGSDYMNGILGHDDIIKMVPDFIAERPLMRSLVAQQFPFLFVDESQDTMESVVMALKAVDKEGRNRFCLGFFGDPMQRIYTTGVGRISPEPGWANISKPENFRCPASVLRVANAVRRNGDEMIQTRGRMKEEGGVQISVEGSAHLFIFPTDEGRDRRISQVRAWAAEKNHDLAWKNEDGVRLLIIVHRMAAKRLGFGELYSALNDKAPENFKNGFLDGSAWPVRPFNSFVLPLVDAANGGREFEVIHLLRKHSPLLDRKKLGGVNVADRLTHLRDITKSLQKMMDAKSGATTLDVLHLLHDSQIVSLDPRIVSYLKLSPQSMAESEGSAVVSDDEEDGEGSTNEIAAMDAFLACPASQFWGYHKYVNGDSPFSTQQGIKGAEFERVLVVLDEDEGKHMQFSYEKYFGIKSLSETDETNIREGKDSIVERTRRLFYVCCTRALKDLVVVLFTADVAEARGRISALGLFPEDTIHTEIESTYCQ